MFLPERPTNLVYHDQIVNLSATFVRRRNEFFQRYEQEMGS